MKKSLIVSLLLCMLMLLCACSNDETPDPDPSEAIIATGDCYKVTENHSSGVTKYHYTISTIDGEELESALCAKKPQVAVLSDTLLGVRFYVDDKSFCRYYDVENGRVSKSFFNAFWDDGELVAYHDYDNGQRMMVSDMFDDDYYYELALEIHSLTITVTSCEQNEETGVLTVNYSYSDDNMQGTVELPTRSAPPAEDDVTEEAAA